MPWRQRNAQKSVMHVQSYCFANLNLLLFCRSRCRRRRRCLSSLITGHINIAWDARIKTKSWVCHSKSYFPLFRPYKGIQDSCEFWIPRRGFQVPGNGFQFFISVTWILNSCRYWHSGSFELYSERIPDSKSKNLLDSGIRIPFTWGGLFVSSQCCSRVSAWR